MPRPAAKPPATKPPATKPSAASRPAGRSRGQATAAVSLTNGDKVFYPHTGFTKGGVFAYYEAIAPVMLPHLAGRPVSLKRMPNGVDGIAFFEKRAPADRPAWVHTATVASTTHGSLTYQVVDNRETLLWLANRAALEFHTYLFKAGAEERPTTLVFDLDPGAPAALRECLPLALEIRGLLAELGLRTFVKSSGGKGLHLLVPLAGTTPFATVKAFARATAGILETRHPDSVTTTMAKAGRTGRIFIDWSQNDHGKTTVCAYSLRARERPTVSAPLAWEEVEAAQRRGKAERLVFAPEAVLQRVAKEGDLLAECLTLGQRLPAVATSRRS